MMIILRMLLIFCVFLITPVWAQGVASGKVDAQKKILSEKVNNAKATTECWSPFAKIEVISKRKVRLQFPQEGVRWFMTKGDGAGRNLSSYGQVIYLSIDEKLNLIERHGTLRVELIPDSGSRKLFLRISQTFDNRSVGGEVETKSCDISVTDLKK